MNWRIGCSGFYDKEWKDFFYPAGLPQKKWFENVVEPRHISWWNNQVMQAFSEHHITFSGISYPSSLPDGGDPG